MADRQRRGQRDLQTEIEDESALGIRKEMDSDCRQ